MAKIYTLFQTKTARNYTLWRRTYLSSLCKGVPPSGEQSDSSFPQSESNSPNELFQKSRSRRIYSYVFPVRLECKNLLSHKRAFKRKR